MTEGRKKKVGGDGAGGSRNSWERSKAEERTKGIGLMPRKVEEEPSDRVQRRGRERCQSRKYSFRKSIFREEKKP